MIAADADMPYAIDAYATRAVCFRWHMLLLLAMLLRARSRVIEFRDCRQSRLPFMLILILLCRALR